MLALNYSYKSLEELRESIVTINKEEIFTYSIYNIEIKAINTNIITKSFRYPFIVIDFNIKGRLIKFIESYTYNRRTSLVLLGGELEVF